MAKQRKAQATGPQWRDLRDWLELVDALGELKHVRGASSEEDIGAITEMLDHAEESPCVLFDEIPNFEPGYRVLVNSMGSRKRQAVTLGLDPAEASHDRLLQFWRELLKGFAPIPPVVIKRGSVQENILRDNEVDLNCFPGADLAPARRRPFHRHRERQHHARSRHRHHQRRHLSQPGLRQKQHRHPRRAAAPRRHHQRKIHAARTTLSHRHRRGRRSAAVSGLLRGGPDLGESELDWAGGVRGAPIEVIQGELTGLPIPAHAEIALEGFITTDEYPKEGPYGEWMGYYQDGYPKDRVVRIQRIYHRNDPIILGCPQGKPPHEDNRFLAYLRSGMIWDQLEKAGVPGVCDVWCPPEAGNRLMTVVALKTQYVGHAKQAGLIASQCGGGIEMNRLTVVVDDHVDVTSIQDVVWAIVARSDPERSVEIIKDTKGSRIDMAIAPDQRELNANSRMIIDATTPFTWKNHPLAGDIISTPERTRAILAKWGWILE